jgi:acylphosphatase
MDRQAVRLSIRGRVQGVGYRWWAIREARRLGLDGWVRNRHDGSVEVLAVGLAVAIETFIEACRHGPVGAMVAEIDRADARDDGGAGFDARPTA